MAKSNHRKKHAEKLASRRRVIELWKNLDRNQKDALAADPTDHISLSDVSTPQQHGKLILEEANIGFLEKSKTQSLEEYTKEVEATQ